MVDAAQSLASPALLYFSCKNQENRSVPQPVWIISPAEAANTRDSRCGLPHLYFTCCLQMKPARGPRCCVRAAAVRGDQAGRRYGAHRAPGRAL
jgi:hypothetical protein